MNKEKSTDEKVYEILCDKFDQMVNENTEAWLFKSMYDKGIVYAEDLAKDRYWSLFNAPLFDMTNYHPLSKVFNDIKWEPCLRQGHWEFDTGFRDMHYVHDEPKDEDYYWMFHVKADNFECAFPIGYLCLYIDKFKKLSGHRGRHKIDWSLTPAYEKIYQLETA